jgi:hypothetical protein
MAEPGPIKFPAIKNQPAVKLSLPRRRVATRSPFEVSEKSAEVRREIRDVFQSTKSPFPGGGAHLSASRLSELEGHLQKLELKLAERERLLTENEARLEDLQRDLAEEEALLLARERLAQAVRKPAPIHAPVSAEEKAALEQLRAELERQEASLKEAKDAVREREQFLDDSETKLFEKVQAQQEKEIELEQREEDLRARERRLREREAASDPAAAAQLKVDDEKAKQRDEFNE